MDRKSKSHLRWPVRVPQCLLPAATARRRHWGKTARGALGRECTRSEVCNPLHGAYVASEALRYSVGFVECVALLAGTGRRDGGWVCRKFQSLSEKVTLWL
jgi:hypothetical protein